MQNRLEHLFGVEPKGSFAVADGINGGTMKLRSKAPILREWEGTGHVSTDLSVSPDGSSVLIIDGPKGGPVGPAEAYTFGYEIVEATDNELEKLREAGYAIPYMGR
jgi:hypothetical protein